MTATALTTLWHSGLASKNQVAEWISSGLVTINGQPVAADTPTTGGQTITVGHHQYTLYATGSHGRVLVDLTNDASEGQITGRRRVYCGLHKCLTKYTGTVLRRACRPPLGKAWRFRHFYHRHDVFYRECADYDLCSVSGRIIDLDRFADIRVVRLVRDPRDLVVSGYHYHRRGGEHWCNDPDPVDPEWEVVNASVTPGLAPGESLQDFLNRVPREQGIESEIGFRARHFQTMLDWPEDPRVLVIRYEDIVGQERQALRRMLQFLGSPVTARPLALRTAHRQRAGRQAGRNEHIRNPASGQWREHFDDRLTDLYAERYGKLLERYGYPLH